jgi:hypothetical protein
MGLLLNRPCSRLHNQAFYRNREPTQVWPKHWQGAAYYYQDAAYCYQHAVVGGTAQTRT